MGQLAWTTSTSNWKSCRLSKMKSWTTWMSSWMMLRPRVWSLFQNSNSMKLSILSHKNLVSGASRSLRCKKITEISIRYPRQHLKSWTKRAIHSGWSSSRLIILGRKKDLSLKIWKGPQKAKSQQTLSSKELRTYYRSRRKLGENSRRSGSWMLSLHRRRNSKETSGTLRWPENRMRMNSFEDN